MLQAADLRSLKADSWTFGRAVVDEVEGESWERSQFTIVLKAGD